jgi:DNA-binding transcriptional LysR family regulator
MDCYDRIFLAAMPSPTLQRLSARLKLRHFALLIELERQASVSRAAQTLGLAQPTVTRALAEIEDILMTSLFVRSRRGLEPTPAGEVVLARARHSLADAAALERDLAAVEAGFRGTLRIGVIPFLSNSTHDALWRHLLELRPALRYEVRESTSDRLLEALKARRIDCAICRFTAAKSGDGLVQRHLYAQEARLVVSGPAAKRLARRALDWEAYASMRWILPPQQTPIRAMIQAIFASAGQPEPAAVLESFAEKTLKSVLRQLPDAITILPDDIAAEIADAAGACVLPQRLQWNLPPIGLVRLDGFSNAALIDQIAEVLQRAHQEQR